MLGAARTAWDARAWASTTPVVPVILDPSGSFTTTATNQWQKSGGTEGWNANVFGQDGFNSGTMIMQPKTTTDDFMVGMSTNNTVVGYPGIDWGISVQAGGTLEIYNAGGSGGNIGTYTTSTLIKMEWTTSDIRYYVDTGSGYVLKATYARSNVTLYLNWCYNNIGAEGLLVSLS
jgi:hypothetical protein